MKFNEELRKLIEQHDKKVRDKAIQECIEVLENAEAKHCDVLNDRYDMIKQLRKLKLQRI